MTSVVTAVASGSSSSTLSQVEPGALAFLVIAAMGLALFFLLKNMNKQFRKIGPKPEETDAESAATEAPAAPGAGQAARPVKAIEAGDTGDTGDTVRTGDAQQDAKAQGATKRK